MTPSFSNLRLASNSLNRSRHSGESRMNSAIALVQIKLTPGQSTDGAVFFPNEGKVLNGGRVIVNTNTDTFEFKTE